MFTLLIFIHISLCVILVGLVLLQQGKGADMGAAFGGGANTIFGAGGATQMIVKITTGVAVAFMISSVLLVKTYKSGIARVGDRRQVEVDVLEGSNVKQAGDSMKPAAETTEQKPAQPAASEAAPAAIQSAPAGVPAAADPAAAGQAAPGEPAAAANPVQ